MSSISWKAHTWILNRIVWSFGLSWQESLALGQLWLWPNMNMCPFSISRGWRDSAKNRISGFSNRFSQTIALMGTDIHQMYLITESGIFVNLGSQDGIFFVDTINFTWGYWPLGRFVQWDEMRLQGIHFHFLNLCNLSFCWFRQCLTRNCWVWKCSP